MSTHLATAMCVRVFHFCQRCNLSQPNIHDTTASVVWLLLLWAVNSNWSANCLTQSGEENGRGNSPQWTSGEAAWCAPHGLISFIALGIWSNWCGNTPNIMDHMYMTCCTHMQYIIIIINTSISNLSDNQYVCLIYIYIIYYYNI